MQRRFLQASELRVDDSGDTPVIQGYAVRFNELSVMLWGFREEIAPGAFADSVANGDVRALWQHDTAQVLGRTAAQTLRLHEDDEGIAFTLDVPDTQAGRDAVTSIRRGDVDSMSFGFSVLPDGEKWRHDEHEQPIRTVTNGTLHEVSPVTWAAYPSTSVEARALWGDEVDIPAELLRAQGEADNNSDQARARSAHRDRDLTIVEMEV